jgi:transcriptional regulator with XRE-family HTH domain
MEQLDWMAQVSTTIASEVRRLRLQRGMSAQRLSDRCAELGAPIPRTVLSNLENGRRGNVTVAELLVLAAALDVPPATLAFPVGYVETVDALPGRARTPLEAIEWVSGHAESGVEGEFDWKDVALKRFRDHARKAESLDASLAHVVSTRPAQAKREAESARMELMVYQERLSEALHMSAEVGSQAQDIKGDTEEGSSLILRITNANDQVLRLQAQVDEARTRAYRAAEMVSVADGSVDYVKSLIRDLRSDREDMVRRGWILPEVTAAVRKALEDEDSLTRWLEE